MSPKEEVSGGNCAKSKSKGNEKTKYKCFNCHKTNNFKNNCHKKGEKRIPFKMRLPRRRIMRVWVVVVTSWETKNELGHGM